MYDLFNPYPENKQKMFELSSKIDGLLYVPDFIDFVEQEKIWNEIYTSSWLTDLKRRVQHYGYKYDYRSKRIDYNMYLGKLPTWASSVINKTLNANLLSEEPDQIIVNEYEPGQGIANHIDCEPCFSDSIASISLGSPCIMELINVKTKEKAEILLEPGSLLVLTGQARYEWTHGIPARKMDVIGNLKFERKLRVSLTFRKVILR